MWRNALGLPLVLALSGSVIAQTTDGVREVEASDRQMTKLSLRLRFTTLIILPDGEEIVDVLCGDKDNWVVSATHDMAHVKPAKEGAQTNLNLVTTSGRVYSFLLTEAKTPPDLKVYVRGDAVPAPGRRKYATAAELAAIEAARDEALAAVDAALKTGEKQAAEAKAAAPGAMQFAYAPVPYVKPFLIRAMFHDGVMTYIKTDATEQPAIYEFVDGKESMVNFQMPQPGTYVVPRVLEDVVFVLGKKRLEVRTK